MKKSLLTCLSWAFLWLALTSSAQAQLFYRTINTGDWATNTTWESATNATFSTGLVSPAAVPPVEADTTISIRHLVTISTTVDANDVTVTTGGTLTVSSTGVLNISNTGGDDLRLARASATNLIVDGGQINCATATVLTSNGFTGIIVEINNNGTINMGSNCYLNTHVDTQYNSTGGGTINFGSGAYAGIRNALGVLGHFASGISFTFTAGTLSGFEFTGTLAMSTGIPAVITSIPYMFVTNTNSVTLNQSMTVSRRLRMQNAGNLIVDSPYELTLTGVSNFLSNATAIITGTGTTTIASGASILGIANLNGLSASSATGAIQTTTRNYSSGATYTFNGTAAQFTGDFFNNTTPTANSVASLSLNNTSGVTLSSNVTVTNTSTATSLIITVGTLALNGNTLTIFNLSGTGTGTITGSSTSSLVVNGSVSMGRVLSFTAGGRTLNNFTYNRSAAGSLGTDLTVVGTYTATAGVFTVNTPNTLTIDGNISLPAGIAPITGTGNFTLGSGATLATAHASGVSGSITISGTTSWNAGANYVFNGATAQNTGLPATLTALNNLTINNSGGDVTLNRDISASGTVLISNNDLNLNGFDISLGNTGTLSETLPTHVIKDNTATTEANVGGYIEATNRSISETYADIAGTRVSLRNEAGGLASYNVDLLRRYHYRADGGKSARLVYQLATAQDMTVVGSEVYIGIQFAPNEVAGITTVDNIFRWKTGTGWEGKTTSNTCGGSISLCTSGAQTSFSHWTVGDATQPLPITLVRFAGERVNGGTGEMTEEVRFEWSTASEINNKGFEVEMSEDGLAYTKIAFVEGKGNSSSVMSYELSVHNASDSYYRLKQIDFDGTFSYSPIVFVEGVVGKIVVYPNPNKGAFTIEVGKDKLESPARLLNAVGKEVWRGVQTEVRTTGLPTGVYFLHTTVAGKTNITKVVIQ